MMTTSPLAGAPADAEATAYGVLRIGGMHVALPLDALREVVPCPSRLEGIPASAPGLLGAFKLRGRVLPVIDLRITLGLPAAAADAQSVDPVVVVLRHAGRMLGLLSDDVCGITRPVVAVVQRVDVAQGGSLLFSSCFERSEDGSVVSVLDPAAVFNLPGLPTPYDDGVHAAREVSVLGRRPQRAMMLVQCGPIGLAINVADVHTSLPYVTLKPSCLGAPLCRGVIEYGDVDVPALDPLALFGLGTLPAEERCQALMLNLDAGFVAVLVSRVIDIVPVGDDEMLPLPRTALRRPDFFSALLRPAAHGDHMALRLGALRGDPDVQSLATMNVRRVPATDVGSGAGQTKGRSVISFDVGGGAATLLLQVLEIISLPEQLIETCGSHAAVLGLVTHRRRSVMLVCLETLMGRKAVPSTADSRVLLIEVEAGREIVGFVVRRLFSVETALWEKPAAAAQSTAAMKPFEGYPLVELGTVGARRTVPLLDLRTLAHTLVHGTAGQSAPQGTPGDATARLMATLDGTKPALPLPVTTERTLVTA